MSNTCERCYQTIKRYANTLMDRIGAPVLTWLLAMSYKYFILNHAYNAAIKNMPLNAAIGSTCDISRLLWFYL